MPRERIDLETAVPMLGGMRRMWPNTSSRTKAFAWTAFAVFVGYFLFVSSWTDLPVAPNPATGHVFAYNIRGHGVMYVTQQELDASRAVLGAAVLLLVASIVIAFRDYHRGSDA